MAYAKDFGTGDKIGVRRATIELDIFPGNDVSAIRDTIPDAATTSVPTIEGDDAHEFKTEELVNEFAFISFYKIVAGTSETYRLRFAVLAEYDDDYVGKINETLNSFTVRAI
jgi:hypothetical protein